MTETRTYSSRFSNIGYEYTQIEIWENEDGEKIFKLTYYLPWYHGGEWQGDGDEFPMTEEGFHAVRKARKEMEEYIANRMEDEEDWHFV